MDHPKKSLIWNNFLQGSRSSPRLNSLVFAVCALLTILSFCLSKPSTLYIKFQIADLLTGSSSSSSSSTLAASKDLFQRLAENGTRDCHNVSTTAAVLIGVPGSENGGESILSTGILHKFRMFSYAADGTRRCFGGDYFETDLSGPNWKSRPPVTDIGDGSYLVELKVDDEFAGTYTFKAILLFSNFHGLDHSSWPDKFAVKKEMLLLRIRFVSSSRNETRDLPLCRSKDFQSSRLSWSGKWTRTKSNDSCELDKEGRYRCLNNNEQCDASQCSGSIASLESNGWVYSTRCKFRIWSSIDAWKCLDGKKLFFWGDSNHQDTIRNLMNFVLGFKKKSMPRIFIANLTNPSNPAQKFKVVEIFNGHTNPNHNLLGLKTLRNSQYRAYVTREFLQGGVPDALILNSGLHDGDDSTDEFAEIAGKAARFWKPLAKGRVPRVIFRLTISPAGFSRSMASNPHKMEAFNAILGEAIRRELGEAAMILDDFDMTFPWHYDNNYSDGGHYGRPPSMTPWFDQVGHHYFVDLMLVHAILTAICS